MGKLFDRLFGRKKGTIEVRVNSRIYRISADEIPDITDEDLARAKEEYENAHEEGKAWERDFAIIMEFANNGYTLEKNGEAEAAAVEYEKAVEFGEDSDKLGFNNYAHSLERLCVLYRKMHRPEDELRAIDKILAGANFEKMKQEYQNRRAKVLAKIEKSK